MSIQFIIIVLGAFVLNAIAGYVLMKRPSQGHLAGYLYEAEQILNPHIAYLGNLGPFVFFISWERFQPYIRVVVWPFGAVVPVWLPFAFIGFLVVTGVFLWFYGGQQ